MARISVIIPVYNTREEFLRECFDSVIGQTFQDLQVIVVDDGSTNPDTIRICDEYGRQYQCFTVLHTKNQGVSNARNMGIRKAKGEYLLFLDSDDWMDPDLCGKLVEYLGKDTPDVIIFNYIKVLADKQMANFVSLPSHKFHKDDISELQLCIFRYSNKYREMNLCTPWGKLFKTSMIKKNKIGFIKGLPRAEDMLFNLNVLERAKDIRYLAYDGYYYRINALSESQSFAPDITAISNKILGYLQEFIQIHHKSDVFNKAYYAYCIDNIYEQMYMYYFHSKNRSPNKIKDFSRVLKQEPYKRAHKYVSIFRINRKLKIYTLVSRLGVRNLFLYFYQYRRLRQG